MMRSMYAGVSGLRTHQTRMDVIGNNIANVNTVAYKSQSMTFAELMYQTTQRASGPDAATGRGGINARQIGLGVKTAAINTNITGQGAAQSTNNPFDIMITGESFFIVNNGQENFFTRDGSFYVDAAGNLAMTSLGYNVMGWQVDPETMEIRQDTVSPLRIMAPENLTNPPEATTDAYVSGIIDKNDTDVNSSLGKTINLQIYDNLGYPYTVRLNIKSTTDEGTYGVELAGILDENNNPIDITAVDFGTTTPVNRETSLTAKDGYRWDGTTFVDSITTPGTDATYDLNTITQALNANPIDPAQPVVAALMDAYGLTDVNEFNTYTFDYTGVPINGGADTAAAGTMTLKQLLCNEQIAVTGAADANNTQNIAARDLLANALNQMRGANNQIDTTVQDQMDNMMENLTATGTVISGFLLNYDPTTGLFHSIGGGDSIPLNLANLTVQTPDGQQSRFENINIDWTTTTMFNNNGTSTIGATNGNLQGLGTGRKLGEMIGVSIQNNGMIYATYDNGQTKLLGQIAVAEFPNASGLEKQGDNLYSATLNSGEFDGIGVDITANGGYMNTGVLEMSNVDLSAEFTEMITTQRGFQANSRIITVSDTMLEELVNLKR